MDLWADRTALPCYHPWGQDQVVLRARGTAPGRGCVVAVGAGAAFTAPNRRGSPSPTRRSPVPFLAPLREHFVLGKTANKTQEPTPESAVRGV